VVTGAGGGLGGAFCRELLRRGARVVASDLKVPDVEGAVAVRCDVTKPADVEALAAEADRAFGGTDLLINNAGVALAGRLGEVSLEDWKWVFDVNVFGVVNGVNAFLPRMRRAGRGHVLNVSSAAGLTCLPLMSAYNASKAAIVSLSETMCGELQGEGVGVTVLCPTFFRTGLTETGRGVQWFQELVNKLMDLDTLGADGVAKFALDAVESGELHAVPQKDGLAAWRLKRLAPAWFAAQGKRAVYALCKRVGMKPQW
jgi:NAD(P)-dependent dehydrogenase (short-subunit alcohol dehydrogenase family)